jgi:hypothetical protein
MTNKHPSQIQLQSSQSLENNETGNKILDPESQLSALSDRLNLVKYSINEPISEDELNACTEREFRQLLVQWDAWSYTEIVPVIGLSRYDFVNYLCYLLVNGVDGMLGIGDPKNCIFNPEEYYGPQHKRLFYKLNTALSRVSGHRVGAYLDHKFLNLIGHALSTKTKEGENCEINYINYIALSEYDRRVGAWPYNPANNYGHEILRQESFDYNTLFENYTMQDYLGKINKVLVRFTSQC